ncbi:MAG TPA: TrbG/VirB9 family P-type conjugative transfer protein [Croceibacterium sp.]
MTRALLAAALAPALLAGTALAAHAQDARLVERLYDENTVVRIEGKAGVQATIRFDEDEHIENVAIGDSIKWQVTPNKRANLLFVKPLEERAATNLTVVTDRHTYLFDLVASPTHRTPLYVLAFTYPEEPEDVEQVAAEGEVIQPEGPTADELAAASDPYAVVDPAELNFAWGTKGDAKLLPQRVYDDGNATFMTWPVGTPLPAILIKDHKGDEGPVNFAVRGDTIVVEGVPREIVLRSGEDNATLTNQGPVRAPRPDQPSLAQAQAPMGPANAEAK